jgi:DNA-binding LacI/PurR family transcriptional regulator
VARLRAFREAMAAHGLPVAEEWVVPHDYTYAQAVTAAQRLFQARLLPSAVIAADDKCAAAVLEVARHAGMRVPDDLSVIGFSDTELCHTWYPPLTTVRQPKAEMGRQALRALTALIEGHAVADGARVHLLPTQLVVRGSCGPYAGPQEAPMP